MLDEDVLALSRMGATSPAHWQRQTRDLESRARLLTG
jgi:hypothetical protein